MRKGEKQEGASAEGVDRTHSGPSKSDGESASEGRYFVKILARS